MHGVKVAAVATALVGSSMAQLDIGALTGLTGLLPAGMLTGVAGLFTTSLNRGYGRVADPSGAAPRRVTMAPRFATEIPGSKTVKIRYGPYSVPNMMHKNGKGEGGSLWNYPDTNVEKPCDKCVIVGMNAGLEYPDGKVANIDTQAWLHHFVLFNGGPGRKDATCAGKTSLPHANVGFTADNSERMFSSGNERTPAFISKWQGATGTKPVGYHIKPSDKFAMIVDLMNDSAKDKTVYLTITFDYMDGHPAGMDDMRPVWFDIDQCALSEVKPTKQSGSFTVRAHTWYSNLEGEILGYAGHLHDGGQSVILDVGGKDVCTSQATYGGPGYVATQPPMENANSATSHISKMSICQGHTLNVPMMKRGAAWTLRANYDYSKNKGMLEASGSQSDIMGIAIMYVRQPWSG